MFDTLLNIALQPVRDTINIVEGLTEGEIRMKATVRLGADVIAGMALSEVVDALQELD